MTRERALVLLLAALALGCGVLAIAYRSEHAGADCWRDQAEQGVAAEGQCERR